MSQVWRSCPRCGRTALANRPYCPYCGPAAPAPPPPQAPTASPDPQPQPQVPTAPPYPPRPYPQGAPPECLPPPQASQPYSPPRFGSTYYALPVPYLPQRPTAVGAILSLVLSALGLVTICFCGWVLSVPGPSPG
jgi:hypothetical protein